MPERTKALMRKFKFCAYDPNDNTFEGFSNNLQRVEDSIALPNKVLSKNGKPLMRVVLCSDYIA